MEKKIFAFLKTKLDRIQDSYLEGVAEHYGKTITEESQIETILDEKTLELVKLGYTFAQKEVDSKSTQAQQTALKNFRKKAGLDEDGKPIKKADEKKEEVDDDPDEPKWAKKLRLKLEGETKALNEKLLGLEKDKTQEKLAAKLRDKIKKAGIDEDWIGSRSLAVESEEAIDPLIETLKGEYQVYTQKMADKGVVISVPLNSSGKITDGELVGARIAEKRNASTATPELKGKKV